MPVPLVWTDPADTILRRLRAEGATWDDIAAAFGLNRSTVIGRGHRIGARPPPPQHRATPPDPSRATLPPGHAQSWGALISGTLLDGCDYIVAPGEPAPLVLVPKLEVAAPSVLAL